jgi:hypothetical protein
MGFLNLQTSFAPGVQIFDNAGLFVNYQPTRFRAVYIVGSGALHSFGTNKPIQVTGVTDFITKFGTSPSLAHITQFFIGQPNGLLYFIDTLCGTANKPTLAEYTAAINAAFNGDQEIGFICAPQIYGDSSAAGSGALIASEALSVGLLLGTIAENFNHQAYVSSMNPVQHSTVAQVQTDGAQYPSNKGNLTYLGNWAWPLGTARTAATAICPVISGILIALATQLLAGGFAQPPASQTITVPGVQGCWFGSEFAGLAQSEISVLNNLGINMLYWDNKTFRSTGGVLVNGCRTRNLTDKTVLFTNQSIVRNVIAYDLKQLLRSFTFGLVDGIGLFFTALDASVEAYFQTLYNGGALYGGGSSKNAFAVECGFSNNAPANLQDGIVVVNCWYTGPVTAERIAVLLERDAIGQVTVAFQSQLGVNA